MTEEPKATQNHTALVTAHHAAMEQHDSLKAPRSLGAFTAGLSLAVATGGGIAAAEANDGGTPEKDPIEIMATIGAAGGALTALGSHIAMRNTRRRIGQYEQAMEDISITPYPTHTKYRHTDGSVWSSPRTPEDSWVITLANHDAPKEPSR